MEWKPVDVDVGTVDWEGKRKIIRNVPAERDSKSGRLRVDPEAVARAELREIADSLGIHERDVLLFLLLQAKPGPFRRGHISQKYKLNKMLWYQWKELEGIGLGEAVAHDEFIAEPRGPVPKNLWDDLTRLKKQNLIRTTGGRRAKVTVEVDLTEDGEEIAKELWNLVPQPYLVVTSRVKDWLFPLDPETIRARVHRDYPEMKKTYTQPDET